MSRSRGHAGHHAEVGTRRWIKRHPLVFGVAVLGFTAIAGSAYAYWTTTGSGTGTAAAGNVVPLTAIQTSVITNVSPGLTAQTLSGNFTNTNGGPVWVATVTASISSVTKDAGAVAGTCDANDFTLASAAMTVDASVPSGVAQGAWTGATIAFNNTGSNQDQCKLATVHFAYTIS